MCKSEWGRAIVKLAVFFVSEAELDAAGGVIACEYCGRELAPFAYSWGLEK
jgi:hypothetical protein